MKKLSAVFVLCALCSMLCVPLGAYAAVRDDATVNRQKTETVARNVMPVKTTDRTNVGTRTVTPQKTVQRTSTVARTAKNTKTTTARTATGNVIKSPTASARSAVAQPKSVNTARAAVKPETQTFGTGYNSCRDSYFTCMDQFCAKANETYRRCVCSSRLEEIKTKERALGQTAQQLEDFNDLNIEVINKTAAEVKAMVSASAGELAQSATKDTSDSNSKLAGISAVLAKTKSNALSTQGKLDIAGDINEIWATTDLAGGADIINLTGESLYNAVHAQCAAFARESCESTSTLNMVISAYGMYIENDCTALSNSLGKKTIQANESIRATEREMNLARLENYDAHNSTSINDCIAQVRKDITANTACGPDYVHCLDITGQYLNRDTGAPIYTPNFYQLEMLTSLTGDVLTNQTNRVLVAELNRKREYAARGLDTCRDLADGVWEEFMRQAIAEIYQGQQARIKQVKTECIDVVNQCYDTQSKSLKDFSNVKEQLLLGARLELSEQMCKDKLGACSNLYGGGTVGLNELVATMKNITDQKIGKECATTLEEYAREICSVPSNDIVHGYPFSCRTYAPGDQRYATLPGCNSLFAANVGSIIVNDDFSQAGFPGYSCPAQKAIKFTSCAPGYFMTLNGVFNSTPTPGNFCSDCPKGYKCAGAMANAELDETTIEEDGILSCGADYAGSLYQKMVRYAMQTCVRPTEANDLLPANILGDVNKVMDKVKVEMGKQLSNECERLGGLWVDTPWVDGDADGTHDTIGDTLLTKFYDETSSNKKWGYCKVSSATKATLVPTSYEKQCGSALSDNGGTAFVGRTETAGYSCRAVYEDTDAGTQTCSLWYPLGTSATCQNFTNPCEGVATFKAFVLGLQEADLTTCD